jgi:putative hydrolase of the HAD superfamily
MGSVLSFDLDGTLIDKNFDDAIWLEELPALYAKQNGIGLAEAKEIFFSEYHQVGPNRMEWYDIDHWFRKMKLEVPARKVVENMRGKIRLYADSLPSLRQLKRRKARMVVLSNSPRMFLEIKMKAEGLDSFFERSVSVPTDYAKVKSHEGVFERLARELGVAKADILHVGDSYSQDYMAAVRAGCQAVLLERDDTPAEKRVTDKDVRKIATLEELSEDYLTK